MDQETRDALIASINEWFSYKAPDESQAHQLQAVSDGAHAFALLLVESVQSGDPTLAVQRLRDVLAAANSAIVGRPTVEPPIEA